MSTYDDWKLRSPDDEWDRLYNMDGPPCCDKCGSLDVPDDENEYGEFICASCEQNAAEAAYERYCEDFYGGGGPKSLREQQIEAMKLK